MKQYYVYIMTNKSGTFYTGVTNNLVRRVYEHKQKQVPGFTKKYKITKLIYFESSPDVMAAINREKEIKDWRRAKKIALVNTLNPAWEDLSAEWYESNNVKQK
ncbi:MAG: GIY-YIG nuclease family protein [candidate division Zixibacteria bacterium]|nr:GIY-YIG nuclease family protein [candidate division Zixibacteria bacterium]